MLENLEQTSALMISSDYKERFKAEYWQAKIRYQKLHEMLVKYECGKLDFQPKCSIRLLSAQEFVMAQYLILLEERARIEGIEL